jgi:hypothetical protein
MKSIRLFKRVARVNWSAQTRRMQAQYRQGQTRTFFNVTEEDFEAVKSSKFLSFAVRRLLMRNQYPTDMEATE